MLRRPREERGLDGGGDTYGLGSVVGMGVDVELVFGVRHVLVGVDLVEFSLSILDFLGVASAEFGVLAKVGANER